MCYKLNDHLFCDPCFTLPINEQAYNANGETKGCPRPLPPCGIDNKEEEDEEDASIIRKVSDFLFDVSFATTFSS